MSFIWTPDFGSNKSYKNNVVETQFGDGYSQRHQVGINPVAEIYKLTFSNREKSEADEIENYIKEKAGVDSFEFTPPGAEVPIYVICDLNTFSRVQAKHNLYNIALTLRQVFDL